MPEWTLKKLLEEARDGGIQVPEFQRNLVLDDDGVRLLLASVSQSYPIGAVTLLEAGNPDLRFRSSLIAGAPASSTEPKWFLIDGQGRMTSLYQALASGQAVQTAPIPRGYYIDINVALDPSADRDAAIISVSELERDPVESEWEQCLFPLRLVFGPNAELASWRQGFARPDVMDRFDAEVLQAFEGYRVPTIIVGKENARWSVRVHGGADGRTLSDRFRTDR